MSPSSLLKKGAPILALLSLLAMTGCGTLMGGLRRDLDDSVPEPAPPVFGGKFNQGFLSESMPEQGEYDRYSAVGHSERAPASTSYGGPLEGNSWVDPNAADDNRRDIWRGAEDNTDRGPANFSNTPSMRPAVKRQYKNGMRATRADFVDESPNEGSLWASDGQTNYYFTKNKVRGIGDILTVNLEQDIVRDMTLEIRRRLTGGEVSRELMSAQERIRAKAMGQAVASSTTATGDRAPASAEAPAEEKPAATASSDKEIPVATEADIDLTKSVELKAGDTMLAEILERYPNGNYKVRGTKRIPYKNGAPRLMTMMGIVRGADVTEDDKLDSGKLYEYRLDATR